MLISCHTLLWCGTFDLGYTSTNFCSTSSVCSLPQWNRCSTKSTQASSDIIFTTLAHIKVAHCLQHDWLKIVQSWWGNLGLCNRSHVRNLRRVHGTSWITFHFQHSTGDRSTTLLAGAQGLFAYSVHWNTVLPASWHQLVTTNSCHITIATRFINTLSTFDRKLFPYSRQPRTYSISNASGNYEGSTIFGNVVFRTSSSNCWNTVWCTHAVYMLCQLAALSWIQCCGGGFPNPRATWAQNAERTTPFKCQ